MENDVGVRVLDEQGMCQVAKGYFETLFLESNSTRAPVVDIIEKVVSDDDNVLLTAPFHAHEFKDAMFSMHRDKCPGPDGFNPGFFQHFWSVCNSDIFQECCAWLNNNQFPPSLNSTNIAHELAQAALSNPSPHIIDDVPTCIWHILPNEMQWIYSLKKKKTYKYI